MGIKTQKMMQDSFIVTLELTMPFSIFEANDIILTLSQGNPSKMYTLQPDAIKVLLRQFENPAKSNSAWKEAVAFTKKVHISPTYGFPHDLLSNRWLALKLTEANGLFVDFDHVATVAASDGYTGSG
jgi:hypothetical protein